MLRQALAERSFLAERGKSDSQWKKVETTIRAEVDTDFRSLRDRFNLLLKKFASEDRENMNKSGTAEQYEEREQLLQNIQDLRRSLETKSKKKEKEEKEAASAIRNAAVTTLKEKRAVPDDEVDEVRDANDAQSSNKFESKRPRFNRLTVVQDQQLRKRLEVENERERIALERDRLRLEEKRIQEDGRQRELDRQAQLERLRLETESKLQREKEKNQFFLQLAQHMKGYSQHD